MNGSICGGVISLSQHLKNIKKDIYADMMSLVMPDKQYKKWCKLVNQRKEKEADKLIEKYARSLI